MPIEKWLPEDIFGSSDSGLSIFEEDDETEAKKKARKATQSVKWDPDDVFSEDAAPMDITPAKTSADPDYAEGFLEKTGRMVSRVEERTVAGLAGAALGMGNTVPSIALKVMSWTDPEQYAEVTKSPETMRKYKQSWEDTPVLRDMSISEDEGEIYRKWRKSAADRLNNDLRASKAAEEADAGPGWWKSFDWWTEKAPEALVQVTQDSLIALGTGGTSLAFPLLSAGGEAYAESAEKARERGDVTADTELLAQGKGILMGSIEYLFDKIGLDILNKTPALKGTALTKFAQKLSQKVGKAAIPISEAAEEAATEVSDMLYSGELQGEADAYEGGLGRVTKAAVLGAVGGTGPGAMGVATDVVRGKEKRELEQIRPLLKGERARRHTDEANAIVEQRITLGDTASLKDLAAKEAPSRKDMEKAGLDVRFNQEERAEWVAKILRPRLDALKQPAPAEAAPPAEAGPQLPPGAQPAPVEGPPVTQPQGPGTFPGTGVEVQEQGAEFGRSVQRDTETIFNHLGKFVDQKKETSEAKKARMDQARVMANQLTSDQIQSIESHKGGTPESGALKQVFEAAEEAKKLIIKSGKKTGTETNEKKMFGLGGWMDQATQKVKKKLGLKPQEVLAPEALAKHEASLNPKTKKYKDVFKHGANFEQNLNDRAMRTVAKRAVVQVGKWIDRTMGSDRFKQYYEQQSQEEEAQLIPQFPELAEKQTAQFYRALNAVAPAQTPLDKNTQESAAAWQGVRSTGQVPVVFTEGPEAEQEAVFALPKGVGSKLEGPTTSEVDSTVEVAKEVWDSIPQDVRDVLNQKAPIPEGLVQLGTKDKGAPVKTYNHYFYEWAAPKYITSKQASRANTTSHGLVLKLAHELSNSNDTAFRNRVRTAFEIGGASSMTNKAENYKVMNKLLAENTRTVEGRQEPDFAKIVSWLNERVPIEEIVKIKTGWGFAEPSNKVLNDIRDTVYVAEGQDKLIPRTFLFGPKVGAYMLNRMADVDQRNADYNTMDVWESRFWRYLNDKRYSNDAGIAEGAERKIFMRQAKLFAEEWGKTRGEKLRVSAGQAARWYMEKERAMTAGYSKAGEGETIPEWTRRALAPGQEMQLGVDRGGGTGEIIAAPEQAMNLEDMLMEEFQYERTPGEGEAEKLVASKEAEKEAKVVKAEKEVEKAKKEEHKQRVEEEKGRQGKLFFEEEEAPKKVEGDKPGVVPGVPKKYVNEDGTLDMYRYSKGDRGPTYNIDPAKTTPSSYSRRDYEQSNVKRTFFYLDTRDHEKGMVGEYLYAVSVDPKSVYNLDKDPAGLKVKHKWGPKTDYQEVMNAVKKAGFDGIYYRSGSMEVVNMFVATPGTKVTSEAAHKAGKVEAKAAAEKAEVERKLEPVRRAETIAEVAPEGTVAEEVAAPPAGPVTTVTTEEAKIKGEVPPLTEEERTQAESITRLLFQKVGGRVLGTMAEVRKNGFVKMIVRAFKGSDIDTGIEEMAHVIRRLVVTRELNAQQRGFSDKLMKAIEKHFGVVDGKWTVEAEENFAKEYRRALATMDLSEKVSDSQLQKAYKRLTSFLSNFYQNVKAGVLGDVKVSKPMGELMEALAERRARLVKGAPAHIGVVVKQTGTKLAPQLTKDGMAGGFTVDLKTGNRPTEGYSVAPSKATEERFSIAGKTEAEVQKIIENYIAKHFRNIARPDMHFGGWLDGDFLVLDVPVVLADLKAAKQAGLDADQDAIFDLKNMKEIRLKKREVKRDDTGGQKPDTKPETPPKDTGPSKGPAKVKKTKEKGPTLPPEITTGRADRAAPTGETTPVAPAAEGIRDQGVPTTEGPSGSIASTLSQHETPEQIALIEDARKQRSLDWKPNNGAKGQRTGKAKPPIEVVRDILARVGIKAEQYKQKGTVLGFYRWALTRIKDIEITGRELWLKGSELASIGTAIHEVAHWIDDKYNISGRREYLGQILGVEPSIPGGFLTSLPASVQAAIRAHDYDPAAHDPNVQLAEGWAEIVRKYCEAPDPTAALGIDAKSILDTVAMQVQEIADLLVQTRAETQAWMNTPLGDQVQAALSDAGARHISPTESYYARQDRQGRSRGYWRLLAKKFQNNLRDLEEYEKELKRQFIEHWSAADPAGAEKAWDQLMRDTGGLQSQVLMGLTNRVNFHTDHAVREGILDPFTFQQIGPSAASLFDTITSQEELADFGRYMYAKVALHRYAKALTEGREYIVGQVDPLTLDQLVRNVESGPNAAKFQQIADGVTDYFNNLLELEVSSGLKTQQQADAMKAAQDIYMPFFRQLDEISGRGTKGKVLGVKSSIMKLKGGSVFPVLDVYDAIVDRTSDVYSEVIRKVSEQNFVRQAELSGVSGDFIRKIDDDQVHNVKATVTTIVKDGESYHYIIDPDLKAALNSVSPEMNPLVAKALAVIGKPTAWARKFMVNFNVPYFTTKNLIRDQKTAAIRGLSDLTGITTTGGIELTTGSLKTAGRALKQAMGVPGQQSDVDRYYEMMGGDLQTRVRTSRSRAYSSQQKRRVFLGTKDRTNFQKARDFAFGIGEKMEAVNDAIETAPRKQAFFQTLRALGQTAGAGFSVDAEGRVTGQIPQWALNRAMYNAMEVTTNFNRRGEWQPYIEPVALFYNAAIQGTAGQFRTLSLMKEEVDRGEFGTHTKRFVISMAVGVAAKAAAMAIMAVSFDDDDESDLDKWAELPNYLREQNDVFLFKGFVVTIQREREWSFFNRSVDSVISQLIKDGSINPWNIPAGLKSDIGARLPVTGGTIPTALQLYFNQDIFRGRPIESQWDQGKLPQFRYDERTPLAARWIGAFGDYTGVSPKEADFAMRNVLGSMGTKFTDFFAGEHKPSNVPFVGPFIHDAIPRQSTSDYMALRERNAMEFDAWRNDRRSVSETATQRILDNEATLGVADSVMKKIREWPDEEMPNDTKQKYITGVARWVLEREPMAEYPNPVLQYGMADIPLKLQKEIRDVLKRERSSKVRADEKIPKGSEKFKEATRARIGLKKRMRKEQE